MVVDDDLPGARGLLLGDDEEASRDCENKTFFKNEQILVLLPRVNCTWNFECVDWFIEVASSCP